MNIYTSAEWLELLGHPTQYHFENSWQVQKKYDLDFCTCELALQANGPNSFQRVMTVFPKTGKTQCPAVAVPFYYPEAMLGFDPETGEALPSFAHITMLVDLARRGYVAATADAFHLTYAPSTLDRDDFSRWQVMSEKLLADHPGWTGMGKLFFDTELLVDSLADDPRVDTSRIGIAGHSLGGKMAFYTGCLDQRIKVILTSDFGFAWEQSNWEQSWYWGHTLDLLKAKGINHTGLLTAAAPKPFALLAGHYDNDLSWEMISAAKGYPDNIKSQVLFVNHATGHRPPLEVLEAGYQFLDKYLLPQA